MKKIMFLAIKKKKKCAKKQTQAPMAWTWKDRYKFRMRIQNIGYKTDRPKNFKNYVYRLIK